jgi:hypothetical protein
MNSAMRFGYSALRFAFMLVRDRTQRSKIMLIRSPRRRG